MNVSVLILTLNEETCISKAIESVQLWSDDVVVLDSGSTDQTEKIASSFSGVRFISNKFKDYSSQRNYGLHSIAYKNEWLLLLDADESCPVELQTEINDSLQVVSDNVNSFIMRRKDYINKTWIKIHASGWFERLIRPKEVEFVGLVHEKLRNPGIQIKLCNYLNHYPMAKGVHHWVMRHSIYAEEMARQEMNNCFRLSLKDLLSLNPIIRTKAYKALYLKIPGRWIAYFLHRLIFKGGFKGGINGIHLTILESFYHFLVVVHVRSMKNNGL